MQTFKHDAAVWDRAKEQARVILAELAARRTEDVIFYSKLAAQITAIKFHPHDAAFHTLLGQLSEEEDMAGRGMMSALVVRQEDYSPGDGFFKLAEQMRGDIGEKVAFWTHEIAAVRAAHQRKGG